MQRFSCPGCANEIHFDNHSCERCGLTLAYMPYDEAFVALDDWQGHACANRALIGCNWLTSQHNSFCVACLHNRTVPNVNDATHVARWQRIEHAKRLLFYSILKWRLPHPLHKVNGDAGLAFDFLADEVLEDGTTKPVLSGHAEGIITLNIAEGDDVEREARRASLGEPYRTLIGHLRHEIGHYYWDVLVRDGGRLDEFRAMFGDERQDYGQALARHYDQGPAPDWNTHFISSYASAHPWEDFAESWAHYMHIIDGLETSNAFGLEPTVLHADRSANTVPAIRYAYAEPDWTRVRDSWIPLTIAINELNRSLGQPDLYPFALSATAMRKLAYIHLLIGANSSLDEYRP